MGHGNAKVRERFELSLGGFQIASIVVGALAVVGVVFFLGFQVGQGLGRKQAEAARPASLRELDAAATAPRPVAPGDITYAQELPKAKPPAAPPPAPARPAKPEPKPEPQAAATPAPEPASPPPAAAEPSPRPDPAGGWTVQLGASQKRGEAEELAQKIKHLGPRIEEADVPGKGHWFRVRVGRFETRAAADKYRSDVSRETGIEARVVSAN